MLDVEILKMSSKGQFVLPNAIRKRFKLSKGEKLILIEDRGTIVLRPVKKIGEKLDDELRMMHRAARGWSEIGKGKARRLSKENFLKELRSW